MPTDFAFRFSTYLTLALACACLGYAEVEYLPEVSVFAGLVVVLLVVAFRAEGRFALSLTAANFLGGALFVIAGGWIAYHWRQDLSLIHTLPWPAGLLPFLGPVIMVGMVAKLLRPKHAGDWWLMHGVSVTAVALAASLTEDVGFVALLLVYAAAGVWSLTLFYQRRAAGLIPPVPPATDAPGAFDLAAWFPWLQGSGGARPVVAGPPPDRSRPTAEHRFGRLHLRKAFGWLGAAAVVALPLFFVTPRYGGLRWQLGKGRMETGYSPEQSIDVGRTGTLDIGMEPAFEVAAWNLDRTGTADVLPADQRWRGVGYDTYKDGKWNKGGANTVWGFPRSEPQMFKGLPDFGPSGVVLEFILTDRVRGVLLAAPVTFEPDKAIPLVQEKDGHKYNGTQLWDGNFGPLIPLRGRAPKYFQAFRPGPERLLGPPFIRAPYPIGSDPLSSQPIPEIDRWTERLFLRLVKEGKIPRDVDERRDPVRFEVRPRDRRVVAEALRDYLSAGGDYAYSLTLTRQNRAIDPIEDFLVNTKTGHCERFAAALALMLRSLGIPAQFVLGYKGCEPHGDGRYLVREQNAHAWVEVILPAADGPPGYSQWMILDPSPSGGDELVVQGVTGLWGAARESSRRFFSEYIIGLTPEHQKRFAESAGEAFAEGGPVAVGVGMLAVFVVVGVLVRRRLRPSRAVAVTDGGSDAAPWFTRMTTLLTARGLPNGPGVTPREYARGVASLLAAVPSLAAVADVPTRLAAALYESRYAGTPLPPDRAADLDREVDRLAAALRSVPEGGEVWHRPSHD